MEVGLDEGYLAHRDIYRWICCRICTRGSFVVEDGHVDSVIETKNSPTRSFG
jgi:hypothetical protein